MVFLQLQWYTTGIDIPSCISIKLSSRSFIKNRFDQVDVKYNFIEYEHQERINGNDNFEVLLAKNIKFKIRV